MNNAEFYSLLNLLKILESYRTYNNSIEYNIIKIVYVTPYDYYRNDLIENTLENLEYKDKENIISLLKIFDLDIVDFKIVK